MMAHSPMMSSNTVSSLFPDRPIRPLPKRRLREKLSPEAAGSIEYPRAALDVGPVFFPPALASKNGLDASGSPPPNSAHVLRRSDGLKAFHGELGAAGGPSSKAGKPTDSTISRSAFVRRSPPEILNRAPPSRALYPARNLPSEAKPPSTASSVDGYESFENTSNKKKRKIPTATDSVLNGVHSLHSEIKSLAISSPRSPISDIHDRASPGNYGASTYLASGQGISGSGRGRIARPGTGRSPLRAIPDKANNSWGARGAQHGTHADGTGIISQSIANAGKIPQGQENVSLLYQSASARATPASAQFTFTCDSQIASNVQWPGHAGRRGGAPHGVGVGGMYPNGQVYPDGSFKRLGDAALTSRKERSRLRLQRRIERNMRQRKHEAAESNKKNPMKAEDRWICEFCEYEAIFGKPPSILIQSFEVKDIRQKQEEADRKRLRSKVKVKSRKGKKMPKASNRGGNQAARRYSGPLDQAATLPLETDTRYLTQSDSDSLVAFDGYQNEEGGYSDAEGHRRQDVLADPEPQPPPPSPPPSKTLATKS